MFVVVEIVIGCDVVAVVVDVTALVVVVALDTRIQQRTPRLRPLAPSTPTCKGAGGLLFITSERRILVSIYSVPLRGMKRSNPESGVADAIILRLWSSAFCLYRLTHSRSSWFFER